MEKDDVIEYMEEDNVIECIAEENVKEPKKRQRLTLEEQAARLRSKMQADEQRLRELDKRIRSRERKKHTRYLIQLGTITEKYLGTVDLERYEAFLRFSTGIGKLTAKSDVPNKINSDTTET